MIGIVGTEDAKTEKMLEGIKKEILEYEGEEYRRFVMSLMSPLSVLYAPYMNPRSSIFPHLAQPDFCQCL